MQPQYWDLSQTPTLILILIRLHVLILYAIFFLPSIIMSIYSSLIIILIYFISLDIYVYIHNLCVCYLVVNYYVSICMRCGNEIFIVRFGPISEILVTSIESKTSCPSKTLSIGPCCPGWASSESETKVSFLTLVALVLFLSSRCKVHFWSASPTSRQSQKMTLNCLK